MPVRDIEAMEVDTGPSHVPSEYAGRCLMVIGRRSGSTREGKNCAPAEPTHVLGAQAQLWTEYMLNAKHVEYMAYPRMVALAEVLWSAKVRRDYADFTKRLPTHLARLDALDVNYRKQ